MKAIAPFRPGGLPLRNGAAQFRVRIAGQLAAEWTATDRVPTRRVDSASSARRVIEGVMLRTGAEIQIEGIPDGGETAALDYIEILKSFRT